MRYISTRGQAPALNFEDVLLAGLASDGGLYVPENLPRFTQEQIASWAGLPYHELAFNVMRPFVSGSMPISSRFCRTPTASLSTRRLPRCVSWTAMSG